MDDAQVDCSSATGQVDSLRAGAQTVMYLSVDGKLAGYVGVSDPMKRTTPEAVQLFATPASK